MAFLLICLCLPFPTQAGEKNKSKKKEKGNHLDHGPGNKQPWAINQGCLRGVGGQDHCAACPWDV